MRTPRGGIDSISLTSKRLPRMSQDPLRSKVETAVFAGKVVRKDLLLQVKKGTNVPPSSWSSCCPLLRKRRPARNPGGPGGGLGDHPKELRAPDESNKAQMIVQQKGSTPSSTNSRQVLREGEAPWREWKTSIPLYCHQRALLPGRERPHLRRRHLGRMHCGAQRRGGRRLRFYIDQLNLFSCRSSTSTHL